MSRLPHCNISSWEGNRGAPSRWQGKSGYGQGEQGIRSVGRVGTSGHVSRSLLEPLLSADTSISSDQQASDTHGPALPNTTPDISLAKLCSSSGALNGILSREKKECLQVKSPIEPKTQRDKTEKSKLKYMDKDRARILSKIREPVCAVIKHGAKAHLPRYWLQPKVKEEKDYVQGRERGELISHGGAIARELQSTRVKMDDLIINQLPRRKSSISCKILRFYPHTRPSHPGPRVQHTPTPKLSITRPRHSMKI